MREISDKREQSSLVAEQVIAGTVAATTAASYGFEVIKKSEALITVKVESSVRQVGKSTVAALIYQTLAEHGYSNVELVTEPNDSDHTSKASKAKHEPNGDATGIRVVVQDTYLYDRAIGKA